MNVPADFECEQCHDRDTMVIDTRMGRPLGMAIRRRRQCRTCGHRFTTYETREVETVRAFTARLELARKTIADLQALLRDERNIHGHDGHDVRGGGAGGVLRLALAETEGKRDV